MPPKPRQQSNHKCLNIIFVMFLSLHKVQEYMNNPLHDGNTQAWCTPLLTVSAPPDENPKRQKRKNKLKKKTK